MALDQGLAQGWLGHAVQVSVGRVKVVEPRGEKRVHHLLEGGQVDGLVFKKRQAHAAKAEVAAHALEGRRAPAGVLAHGVPLVDCALARRSASHDLYLT